MTSPFLNILDITDGQKQQEAARSQQSADLGYAMNRRHPVSVDGDLQLTEDQQKRFAVLQYNTGTVSADFTVDMFDTAERAFIHFNNTTQNLTLRNSTGGGITQPVLLPGDVVWVHYDGLTFIELGRSAPKGLEFLGQSLVTEGSGGQVFDVFGDLDALPELVQEGDLIVAVLGRSDNANTSQGITSTHGYSAATNAGSRGTLVSMYVAQHYKIAGASEEQFPHWTNTHNCYWSTLMMHFRGHDPLTPFDVSDAHGFNNGGTFNLDASPTNAFSLAIWSGMIRSANVDQSCLISRPADSTLDLDLRDASPGDGDADYRLTVAHQTFFSAGATGNQQWVFGGSGGCSLAISTIQEGVEIQCHYNSA